MRPEYPLMTSVSANAPADVIDKWLKQNELSGDDVPPSKRGDYVLVHRPGQPLVYVGMYEFTDLVRDLMEKYRWLKRTGEAYISTYWEY